MNFAPPMTETAVVDKANEEIARLQRELDRIADAVALEIRPMESVVECVERLVRERR